MHAAEQAVACIAHSQRAAHPPAILSIPLPAPQRYAQRDAAAAADRTYLHAAALRFWCQGAPVQVVCPPADGAEFTCAGFQQLFHNWLPASLEAQQGCWFEDSKLLRSQLAPATPPE